MALQVYRASAGSGKTYTLTLEFFKIVFAAPLEYRNVLAVTFTNKATGEMKSRIVKELHALAEGERTSYGEALERELGLSAEEVKLRAGILRTLVLHDYGRLSVTTIDKFFQRILKSFTRELGIFPGYNVELDSEYVLLQAVDQVMRRLNEDADLRAWVNDLMNTSVEESHSWNVKMKISELGKDLFGETYILLPEELKRKFNDRPFLRGYRTFLRGVMERFDRQLRDYGETACRLLADNDLQPSDFKGSSRSFAHHFTKLREGAVDKITPTVRKAADNAEEWSTKTTPPAKRAAIEGIFPELNRCLRESIAFFDEQWPAYNSARFLLDVLYQLGILQDLYQEVRGYCDEKGLMLLSDTTRLLNALIAGNDAPFLFEKTGNFYKHVMIDEFQDTSAMQWANFRPLVQNTLAEGGRALVVGDVKQSIYRWRNGDWKLLAGGLKQELTGSYIQDLVLENNWRSARTIVDFNNRVFDMAPRMLAELFDRECGGENPYSSSIIDAYAGQRQNVRKKREGYVEIRFGGEQREEESQRAIL